jgi:hypothetical protein
MEHGAAKMADFLAFPGTENPCVGGSTPPLGTTLNRVERLKSELWLGGGVL